MLTLGHLSASYLISQIPMKGRSTKIKDVVLILAFGYLLDLDLLISPLFGLPVSYHHFLFTHTPVFVLIFCLTSSVLLRRYFSTKILFLAFCAMFMHLILDDVGYWFQLLGLQEESKIPQIFWLYPFDPRWHQYLPSVESRQSGIDTVILYVTKAPANVVVEIYLFVSTLFVLWKKRSMRSMNKK